MIRIGRLVDRGTFYAKTDYFSLFFNPDVGATLIRRDPEGNPKENWILKRVKKGKIWSNFTGLDQGQLIIKQRVRHYGKLTWFNWNRPFLFFEISDSNLYRTQVNALLSKSLLN